MCRIFDRYEFSQVPNFTPPSHIVPKKELKEIKKEEVEEEKKEKREEVVVSYN